MPDRFHLVLRLLHWTMALLILAMLFIGVGMVSSAGPLYSTLLALHRPIGIAILLLAVVRIAVRRRTAVPPLPDALPSAQAKAARASHWLLYGGMLGVPLIGWAMLSAGGYPVTLMPDLSLPPILPQSGKAFGLLRNAHGIAAILFFALILGHLTMALIHGVIRRDRVLATMSFGLPSPRRQDQPAEPVGAELLRGALDSQAEPLVIHDGQRPDDDQKSNVGSG